MNRRDPRSAVEGDAPATSGSPAATRWGGATLGLPVGSTLASPGGRPFGSSAWRAEPTQIEPVEDEVSGPDDLEEEEGPRRRRVPEKPLYPRKSLAALGAAVRVTRGLTGVPHIAAKSERDAWAALGWCMAQDRIRQLDLLRRLANGRAAELLGRSVATHDAMVRTAGVPRRALAAAGRLTGAANDVLAAFTSGVNAVLAEGAPRQQVPPTSTIEPWTIADSIAIEILRAWSVALRTWPEKLLLARAVAHGGSTRTGWIARAPLDSRLLAAERVAAWRAIDPSVTELVAGLGFDAGIEGTAWAACGPAGLEVSAALHASPWLPSAFYEARLEAPGLDVAGTALLGVPVFPVGRNRSCAWAGVAAIVDDCDVLLEELDGIGHHRTPSGWEKLAVRRETVRVREGDSLTIEVVETRNGPLVSHLARQLGGLAPDARSPAIAVHWGAGSLFSSVASWLAVARAGDVDELGAAAAAFERSTHPVRLVGGDAGGRVGSWTAGSVPVRDARHPLPLFGWTGEGAWTAVRAASAAETASAPGSDPGDPGFVAACGETARATAPGSRLARLVELRSAGADSLGAWHRDEVDPVVRGLLPVLRQALAATESDPAAAGLREALTAWDGAPRSDGHSAAVALAAVYHFLPAELFPLAAFGALASFPRLSVAATARILSAESSPWFSDASSRDRAVAAALLRSAAWLARAESTSGRLDCAALLGQERRHPHADEPSIEPAVLSNACGSPASLAMLDWRGPGLPFAVELAPARWASSILSEPYYRASLAGGAGGAPDAPPSEAPAADPGRGPAHELDLSTTPVGEILDLVAG